MLEYTLQFYDDAAQYILHRTRHRPTLGLVLGSGLSPLADAINAADTIAYEEIPHFPVSTVQGHTGRMVLGELAGVTVCAMQGRFHYYEGYSLQLVTLPIRVMHRLGVDTVILTNAAGGINQGFAVGDLMVIEDHVNFPGLAGQNPLRGPNLESFGTRFPPANRTYTRTLRDLALARGTALGLPMRRGVYAMVGGPNFETPAEIRLLRLLGVDAVGMSTVPEALVARHAGMNVLAVSTITNICVDRVDADEEPTHEEVNAAGKIIVPRLMQLLLDLIGRMDE